MSSIRGCFDIIVKAGELDIDFVARPLDTGSIPADQQELYLNVKATLNNIKSLAELKAWKAVDNKKTWYSWLFKRSGEPYKRLIKYVSNLAGCAKVGLEGSPNTTPSNLVSIDLANKELEAIKAEILQREGTEFKTQHVRRLGFVCLSWSLIFSIFLFWPIPTGFLGKTTGEFLINNLHWFAPMAIGTLVGLWFSFMQRKKDMNFDDLAGFEKDRIKPFYRCMFVIVIAVILYGLLAAKLITVGVGAEKFDIFSGSRWFPFLLGVAVGATERSMGDTVLGALPNKK
jgi:hypothetical protein